MTSPATAAIVGANRSRPRIVPWIGCGLLLLALTAGCALTPTNIASNLEVDRLCAKDGGIRVYEKVYLSTDKFYTSKERADLAGDLKAIPPEFRMTFKQEHLSSAGERGISRELLQIWREADNKLMGEVVTYAYATAEATLPWRSVHACAGLSSGSAGTALRKQLFIKEG
jgi:hypothetical protein